MKYNKKYWSNLYNQEKIKNLLGKLGKDGANHSCGNIGHNGGIE
jgi:hypothetical protein